MLRERYAPRDLFALVPVLGMALAPVLTRLDTLLDDAILFQAVKAALARRFPRTLTTGRLATPVEGIGRLLVGKHLYGWSDEQTERFVADRLVLRQFCRVYAATVPDETTLLRWANLIQPATLPHLNAPVVAWARSLTGTRGRQRRIDGTVVETPRHHPTDSTLLYDGVRVLSRTVVKAKHVRPQTSALARTASRDRPRSATRQMQRSMDAARKRGVQAVEGMRTAYERLLTLTTAVVQQAEQVQAVLSPQTTPKAQPLVETFHQMGPLVQQSILQTTRRIMHGEAVPATEKLVSLCEPHTAIIRTGKPGRPTEFGRVIWLDAVAGGLMSRSTVLDGHPAEEVQWPVSLTPHLRVCHRPPQLRAGDRGVYTTANER